MTDLRQNQNPKPPAAEAVVHPASRATWGRLGRFAAITPPAVTLLLSAMSKPAAVATSGAPGSSRQLKEPVAVTQLRKAA
jgi:hypothetical protein